MVTDLKWVFNMAQHFFFSSMVKHAFLLFETIKSHLSLLQTNHIATPLPTMEPHSHHQNPKPTASEWPPFPPATVGEEDHLCTCALDSFPLLYVAL